MNSGFVCPLFFGEMGRGGYPLDVTVGAATSRPHPRIFDSTRLNGTVDNNVPFNGRLSSVTFGRILSAPTERPTRRVHHINIQRKEQGD